MKTIQYLPNALARSLQDSVFPVPAGPAGAAPNFIPRAPVIVIQQRSVRGVMTSLAEAPKYSYPYGSLALTWRHQIESSSM